MPFIIIGLPLILFGVFSRAYGLDSSSEHCFFVDVVNLGPFCWADPSIMPKVIVYGARALGVALVIFGTIMIWRAKRSEQQPTG